jgi:hypothetical protein
MITPDKVVTLNLYKEVCCHELETFRSSEVLHLQGIQANGKIKAKLQKFLTSTKTEVSGQPFIPNLLFCKGNYRQYPLNKLGGPQGRSELFWRGEIFFPCPKLDPDSLVVQLVAESLFGINLKSCYSKNISNSRVVPTSAVA